MSWKLTGDTPTSIPDSTVKVNADKLNSMILPAVHTIACDYDIKDTTDKNSYQYFKVFNGSPSFTESKQHIGNVEKGIKWETSSTTDLTYANLNKGLTLVAQWRWRQTFIPQIESDISFANSAEGGTVEILNMQADNGNLEKNHLVNGEDVGATAYFAAANEQISAKATARDGYRFVGWYDESGKLLSINDTYGVTVNACDTKKYYARFEPVLTQNFVRQLLVNGAYLDIDSDSICTLSRYYFQDI